MHTQPSLFDARTARDAAIAQVDANSDRWIDLALLETISLRTFKHGQEFTGEQLRRWLVPLLGNPHTPKVFGALTMQLIRQKIIEDTGRMGRMTEIKSHARKTTLYRWRQ